MATGDPRTLRQRSALTRAIEVLGSEKEAQRWMRGAILSLNNQRPCDLVRTASGAKKVLNVLNAIEHGVFL